MSWLIIAQYRHIDQFGRNPRTGNVCLPKAMGGYFSNFEEAVKRAATLNDANPDIRHWVEKDEAK